MKAEVLNGHLHIYPDTYQDEKDLLEFRDTGVNNGIGTVFLTMRNGRPLLREKLLFIKITKRGINLI